MNESNGIKEIDEKRGGFLLPFFLIILILLVFLVIEICDGCESEEKNITMSLKSSLPSFAI